MHLTNLHENTNYFNDRPAQLNDGDERIRELELELARQWLSNHAEHCGRFIPPWPHHGPCHCELPAVLDRLGPSVVYLLLLEASGEAFGLHLQGPEC
jgi:hypothetical protein